jgi:ABC-type branched-subunit amino acid transport system substrate-binding protein
MRGTVVRRRTPTTLVRHALVALLAVTVMACGTRLNEAERASFAGSGGGGSQATAGTGSGVDADGTPVAEGTPGSTGGSATTGGSTGSTGSGTPTGGQAAPSDQPCAAPSKEVGVTDSTIVLGGVFTLSGILPGFAQPALNGARAYVDYLNSTGGLCGRKVEYVALDDGFDASRNNETTRTLMGRAVSLVAGFTPADDGGASALAGSNVLDISTGTTPARQTVPNHYATVTRETQPGEAVALPEYKFAVANGAKKIAIIAVSAAAGRALLRVAADGAKAAGMDVVLQTEVSPTQFSYASTARAIADSGAQMMLSLIDINGSVQLAEELARVPNQVKYPFYRLGYDQRFIDQAGAAAEGSVSFIEFLPFEEPGTNAALDAFLEHNEIVAPDRAPNFQSMLAWINMETYAQVIRSLKGPITRDALLEAAADLHKVDGHGLFEPFDLGGRTYPSCKVIVRVVDGKYKREAPASGFYC